MYSIFMTSQYIRAFTDFGEPPSERGSALGKRSRYKPKEDAGAERSLGGMRSMLTEAPR